MLIHTKTKIYSPDGEEVAAVSNAKVVVFCMSKNHGGRVCDVVSWFAAKRLVV